MAWLLAAALVVLALLARWCGRRRQRALAAQLTTNIKVWPLLGNVYKFLGNDMKQMEYIKDIAKDAIEADGVSKIIYLDQIIIMAIWRGRRKLMLPTFKTRNIALFCEVFHEHSNRMADLMEQEVGKEAFSFWDYMSTYSFGSVCETTMGVNMKVSDEVLLALEELWAVGARAVLRPWLVWLLKLRAPHMQTHRNNLELVRGFIASIINMKRQQLENTNQAAYPRGPRVASYLERQLLGGGARLQQHELLDECVTIVVAGFDTTALTGAFCMLLLAEHPRVQDRVYAELQEVFGESGRPAEYGDLLRLEYLEAVLKETLRLYPPVPIIARTPQHDLPLPSGLTLVAGVGVLINIWGVQRHPQYWGPDPDAFRPERFLQASPPHPAAFMPFGFGPRNCVGYRYGLVSLLGAVSVLLRRYRVLPARGAGGGELPQAAFSMLLKHTDNYRIRIQRRH